jgi:hypothetical protein
LVGIYFAFSGYRTGISITIKGNCANPDSVVKLLLMATKDLNGMASNQDG